MKQFVMIKNFLDYDSEKSDIPSKVSILATNTFRAPSDSYYGLYRTTVRFKKAGTDDVYLEVGDYRPKSWAGLVEQGYEPARDEDGFIEQYEFRTKYGYALNTPTGKDDSDGRLPDGYRNHVVWSETRNHGIRRFVFHDGAVFMTDDEGDNEEQVAIIV